MRAIVFSSDKISATLAQISYNYHLNKGISTIHRRYDVILFCDELFRIRIVEVSLTNEPVAPLIPQMTLTIKEIHG